MSFTNYESGIQMIVDNPDLGSFFGEHTHDYVIDVFSTFGLNVRGQYLDFTTRFGAGDFAGVEIFGVVGKDGVGPPSVVWFTHELRSDISVNLPSHLLPIFELGDGEIFCLDYSDLNKYREPSVIAFQPGVELKSQNYDLISEDFGDFIFEWFSISMDDQKQYEQF